MLRNRDPVAVGRIIELVLLQRIRHAEGGALAELADHRLRESRFRRGRPGRTVLSHPDSATSPSMLTGKKARPVEFDRGPDGRGAAHREIRRTSLSTYRAAPTIVIAAAVRPVKLAFALFSSMATSKGVPRHCRPGSVRRHPHPSGRARARHPRPSPRCSGGHRCG